MNIKEVDLEIEKVRKEILDLGVLIQMRTLQDDGEGLDQFMVECINALMEGRSMPLHRHQEARERIEALWAKLHQLRFVRNSLLPPHPGYAVENLVAGIARAAKVALIEEAAAKLKGTPEFDRLLHLVIDNRGWGTNLDGLL